MRTILKYTLIIMLVLMTACGEDFVTLTNPNQLTTGSFWKTEEDAVLATTAIYQALIYDGTFMRKYPWTMDVRADDCYNVTPQSYVMSNLTTYTVGGEELEQPWECNYVGIWRANQLLDNIENIEMDGALKTRLIGEAKFLRALYYFDLMVLYNNAVIYEQQPQSTDDFLAPLANENWEDDAQEVWDLIYADLEDAIQGCAVKSDVDFGHATKAAAAAMMVRALLQNTDRSTRFSDAIPYLEDILSSADGGNQLYGEYALVEDYRQNFIEAGENNIESIFEIQYHLFDGLDAQGWIADPQPNWMKSDGYNKSLAPQPFGWGDIAPSVWIWEKFQEEQTTDGQNDPRMEASFYFEHPGDTTYKVYGQDQSVLETMSWATVGNVDGLPLLDQVFIRKYLTEDPGLDEAWKSGINRRLIRYAGILLLYAECLNETGNQALAAEYIQKVRDRANLPDRTSEFAAMNRDQLFEQIDHERALEFCFEAQRYLDLLRWGYFESQATVNEILMPRDGEYQNWLPGREYLALPPTEIERTNGVVVQNPAWN